jgi:hypothetical protein
MLREAEALIVMLCWHLRIVHRTHGMGRDAPVTRRSGNNEMPKLRLAHSRHGVAL